MTQIIIAALLALALGVLSGIFIAARHWKRRHAILRKSMDDILESARKEGETLKKEKILEARDALFREKEKFEASSQKKKTDLIHQEQDLRTRENQVAKQTDALKVRENDLRNRQKSLSEKENRLQSRVKEVDAILRRENETLEKIAGMTEEEARKKLYDNLLTDVKREGASMFNEIREHAKLHAYQDAQRIVVSALERTGVGLARESTITTVELPSDDIKGRIIGRDGRNIRAFENCTGVEVLVDDTPQKVSLSSYRPYRREIARLALEKLIADGRIHPARIEEIVEKVREEINEFALEQGNQAILDLGIHGLHEELVKLLGRLHFHNVLGQNALKHSLEVAIIADLLAAELNMDTRVIKRAALLHDIGLAVSGAVDVSHAEIGADIARKYQESDVVVHAIREHQNRENTDDIVSQLIYMANQLSMARPGVRSEELGKYVKRLDQLEELCRSMPGVSEAYAIQAGREVRIIVDPGEVADDQVAQLSDHIAERIKSELRYPGQIKITVIREFRVIEFAK